MPEKLTIEYVKDYVDTQTSGRCAVLDEEYKNDREKLKILCECGETFYRDFAHVRRGRLYCSKCSIEMQSAQKRKGFEEVKKIISDAGCEYISGEYRNNRSKLTLRCRCGNIFEKSMAKFTQGQDRCCQCGMKALSQSKIKYDSEYVKNKIAERGYKQLEEYKNTATKFKCVCQRGHEFYLRFDWYLQGCSGCQKCSVLDHSGENNWNYQGGTTNPTEGIRKALGQWKRDVKNAYGNICAVTGEPAKRLVVHHLISFENILSDASNDLGIEIKEKIGDYENRDDYEKLKDEVLKRHNIEMGLPISQGVHLKFHKKYSKKDNTPEQFDEFLRENYNISLEDIKSKKSNKSQT